MTDPWERELNRLERDIHAAQAVLAEGDVPPAEQWYPPEGLGPLPAHLRPRVDALLAQMQEVVDAASKQRDRLGEELAELHRRRDAAMAYGQGASANNSDAG